jgi:hypothetical protein
LFCLFSISCFALSIPIAIVDQPWVVCNNQTQAAGPGSRRVVELRLPGKRLVRTIPLGTVGNLTAL